MVDHEYGDQIDQMSMDYSTKPKAHLSWWANEFLFQELN